MKCILCGEPLQEIPFYNHNDNEKFTPSVPFCVNNACPRFGILTIVFKSDEEPKVQKTEETPKKGKKSKRKRV